MVAPNLYLAETWTRMSIPSSPLLFSRRDQMNSGPTKNSGMGAYNTLPDAYYKRGLAFNALGQVPQAQESFDFVVKTYPDSNAGRLAKQALDRLNRVPR